MSPSQVTLFTPRLVLRPMTVDDAPAVERLAGDRAVADTTLTIPHPYPPGAAREWIATHAASWQAGAALTLAVTTADDGLVGCAGLALRPAHRCGELGYWVGVPWWGRGYATESARALIWFGFTHLQLHRIEARHFARNPASGRVMRKLGMRHEGCARGQFWRWDRPEDIEMYAILRDDPEAAWVGTYEGRWIGGEPAGA